VTGLAVPVPAQVSPGNYLTAALWNASVYNGMTFALNVPMFHAYQSSAQSISSGAWAAISLNTTTIDTYGGHSDTVNNSRYTAQVAGWYMVSGVAAFGANATGFRAAKVNVNGSTTLNGGNGYAQNTGGTFNCPATSPVRPVYLNVGDYVELYGFQNSGGAISTTTLGELASALTVVWLHA